MEEAIIKLNTRNLDRGRERRTMRLREAVTAYQQNRLAREEALRPSNGAMLIGKIFRGHRIRNGPRPAAQAVQAQAQAAGLSPHDLAGAIGSLLTENSSSGL